MPLSPLVQLSGLSASAGEMQLTSTPEDLIAKEAAEVEQRVLERDNSLQRPTAIMLKSEGLDVDPAGFYSPLRNLTDRSSSPVPRKRLQDLKADVPLTPLEIINPPTKKAKTVSFPEECHTMIPSPDSDMSMLDPQVADQELASFIAIVAEPLADLAIQQVENEQLVEFDTTMRVPVPPVQGFEPNLPWKSHGHGVSGDSELTNHEAILLQTKLEHLTGESDWGGISKIERQLPWSPFPARLGKVQIHETFDDGSLTKHMVELTVDDNIDIDSLISKPLEPRIVDDTETETDLQPTPIDDMCEEPSPELHSTDPPVFPSQKQHEVPDDAAVQKHTALGSVRLDMQTLLKKRKLELEGANIMKPQHAERGNDHNSNAKANGSLIAKPSRFSDVSNDVGAISSFMHLHGGSLRERLLLKRSSQTPQEAAPPAVIVALGAQEASCSREQYRPLPVPTLVPGPNAAPIIMSSSSLANRELIRQILDALSATELVERDAIPTLSPSFAGKHGESQEADLTISPSTGIIMTTLQKLKQKPLPCQLTFFGVQERIAWISQRYSKLIVLISEARRTTGKVLSVTGVLDDRDAKAVSELMGFVATLECDVTVYYVAGGDSELARWIAAAICRNAILDEQSVLLQDETLWERFLRGSGLNSFAAQSILVELKQPESTSDYEQSSISAASSVTAHGLNAFMQMTGTQRMDSFGQSIGKKVLCRVSEAIDGVWLPATAKATRF